MRMGWPTGNPVVLQQPSHYKGKRALSHAGAALMSGFCVAEAGQALFLQRQALGFFLFLAFETLGFGVVAPAGAAGIVAIPGRQVCRLDDDAIDRTRRDA